MGQSERRTILEHLKERGVPDSAAVLVDETEGYAYFLLYNFSGKLVGVQRYLPDGYKERDRAYKKAHNFGSLDESKLKYLTKVTRENPERNIPQLAVYGLHTLDERPFVFVVEGIFDAVKLESLGLPVIAVLANAPKKLVNFFFVLQKKVIVWKDRDKASEGLDEVADVSITTPEPYEDLGDMPLEKVKERLKNEGFL
jgi:hypothetical protein